jgi:hypothetical protein
MIRVIPSCRALDRVDFNLAQYDSIHQHVRGMEQRSQDWEGGLPDDHSEGLARREIIWVAWIVRKSGLRFVQSIRFHEGV